MVNRARKEYHNGRTVDSDETNHSIVHCSSQHMEVVQRQGLIAGCFQPNNIRMVMLKVVDIEVTLRVASTAASVAGFNRACAQYLVGCTVDGD